MWGFGGDDDKTTLKYIPSKPSLQTSTIAGDQHDDLLLGGLVGMGGGGVGKDFNEIDLDELKAFLDEGYIGT